jgi:hypothetical protein
VTWTPPDPYHQPLSWKLANSAWLLAPILTFGCASVAGFLYVGLRARRPAWWIAGICYTVAANVFLFAGDSLPDESNVSVLMSLLWVLTWVASVAHAVAINGSWLRWLAGQRWPARAPQSAPWSYGPPQQYGPPQPYAPPLPPQVQQAVPNLQQYYATPPSAGPAPAPAVPPPLDVNTADLEDLAALAPIGPERAARVVAARQERNGFASVAEFAAVADLAPHQFAGVRDRLTCTPLPAPPAQKQPERDVPYGRIVDL